MRRSCLDYLLAAWTVLAAHTEFSLASRSIHKPYAVESDDLARADVNMIASEFSTCSSRM